MDPVTHGIAGALLGKGYFSERYGRVAVFAATLGAVFPDVDVTADIFSRDPLAIVKYHRAITHSFVALPVFAFLLAVLTRLAVPWLKKRSERFRNIESPPLAILTLIYGIGIASHIMLDGMTSFGTRMWYPISSERVAWDLLFIIDLTFMAILLLPQMLPWIYSDARPDASPDPSKSRRRAWQTWIWFSVGTLACLAANKGRQLSLPPLGSRLGQRYSGWCHFPSGNKGLGLPSDSRPVVPSRDRSRRRVSFQLRIGAPCGSAPRQSVRRSQPYRDFSHGRTADSAIAFGLG